MQPEPNQKKKGKFEELHQQISPELKKQWENEQASIRNLIVEQDSFNWNLDTLRYVCGVDLSARKNKEEIACVGLVVYDLK